MSCWNEATASWYFWGVNVPCSGTQHGLTRVGLEPRPLDPESEALTTRPPRSPRTMNVERVFIYHKNMINEITATG